MPRSRSAWRPPKTPPAHPAHLNRRIHLGNDFQAVVTLPKRWKVLYFDGNTITCQIRRRKYFTGGHMAIRRHHHKPRLGQVHRGQNLADTFRPRGHPINKNRNVRPQPQSQGLQAPRIQAKPPKMVQRNQCRGGVGASAPQTTPHRQTLVDGNRHPLAATGFRLQQTRRPHGQILFGRHARQRISQRYRAWSFTSNDNQSHKSMN